MMMWQRKQVWIIGMMVAFVALAGFSTEKPAAVPGAISIPATPQYPGNDSLGYLYLVTGDYLKSGLPVRRLLLNALRPQKDYLQRGGVNAGIPYQFNIVEAPNGSAIAAPNCLYCHAQVFNDSLIIGLGNSLSDYTRSPEQAMKWSSTAMRILANKQEREAAANLLKYAGAAAPYMVVASRGVNIADRLTAVLAAHRDPASFVWSDSPRLTIPEEVIPTDVPAWWLLKKKHGMFYTGFGRGDFPRFLMAANLLTVTDTAEAAQVLPHFDDVLAYLNSLKPPVYPHPVDISLALQGEALFNNHCSKCHGTYGPGESYPNLLIPVHVVKTDSALVNSHFSSPEYMEWFQQSWFRQGPRKAELVPFKGYIAPPLDGVWITAPYLHNGSVPDLESLLDSKQRPTFWERNFSKPTYNYQRVGYHWQPRTKPENKSTYNTTLRGYGNHGHTFGDKLTNAERKAVIEYLKTL